MLLDDLWRFLQRNIFCQPSTPTLFNQYRDIDPEFDLPGAARIRRANLKTYLASFRKRPTLLLVGEAPGPNGCRFSGIPFTSEFQLITAALPFAGRRSSNRDRPYKETSGTTLWGALAGCESQVLVWNCVPFHPHHAGQPRSIRTPTLTEVRHYAPLLRRYVEILRPRQVVAIGNHAARSLGEMGIAAEQVRHPSHGGVPKFKQGIRRVLRQLRPR